MGLEGRTPITPDALMRLDKAEPSGGSSQPQGNEEERSPKLQILDALDPQDKTHFTQEQVAQLSEEFSTVLQQVLDRYAVAQQSSEENLRKVFIAVEKVKATFQAIQSRLPEGSRLKLQVDLLREFGKLQETADFFAKLEKGRGQLFSAMSRVDAVTTPQEAHTQQDVVLNAMNDFLSDLHSRMPRLSSAEQQYAQAVSADVTAGYERFLREMEDKQRELQARAGVASEAAANPNGASEDDGETREAQGEVTEWRAWNTGFRDAVAQMNQQIGKLIAAQRRGEAFSQDDVATVREILTQLTDLETELTNWQLQADSLSDAEQAELSKNRQSLTTILSRIEDARFPEVTTQRQEHAPPSEWPPAALSEVQRELPGVREALAELQREYQNAQIDTEADVLRFVAELMSQRDPVLELESKDKILHIELKALENLQVPAGNRDLARELEQQKAQLAETLAELGDFFDGVREFQAELLGRVQEIRETIRKEDEEKEFEKWKRELITRNGRFAKLKNWIQARTIDSDPTAQATKLESDIAAAEAEWSSFTPAQQEHATVELLDPARKLLADMQERIEELRVEAQLNDWKASTKALRDAIQMALALTRSASRQEIETATQELEDAYEVANAHVSEPLREDKHPEISHEIHALNNDYARAQEKLQKNDQGTVEAKISTVQLERFRTKDIKTLLRTWYTLDVAGSSEGRQALEIALGEKYQAAKQDFIDHGNALGIPESESEERWRQFVDVAEHMFNLTDFGIMRGDTLNDIQFTANHEAVLARAKIPGAMKYNAQYNALPLVGAVSVHPGEQSARDMGLIQKLVYAAYQEMRKLPPSDDELRTAIPGYDTLSDAQKYQRAREAFGKGDKKVSFFSRNQGFTGEMAADLINSVAEMDTIQVLDGTGDKLVARSVNIRQELEKFPDFAKDAILFFAHSKASRDDLGTKAGIWHLGKNKGAFKFADGGDGRPAGVIASILYQVGKNTARERHAAMLNFVDLRRTELMSKGRPTTQNGSIDQSKVDDYHNWKGDEKNREVVRFSQELRNFNYWSHPQYREILADRRRFKMFEPTHWYQDFPALDEFFNQGVGAKTPEDYKQSRDAVLHIIEMASDSPAVTLSTDTEELRQKIIVKVKGFNSEIGKALSFLGPYTETNKYKHVHELMLAAYQFFLGNLLMAVPGDIPFFNPGNLRSLEYEELYKIARNTIHEVIELNSTLSGYYQANTIGKGSDKFPDSMINGTAFIDQPEFKKRWRDESKLRNQHQSWLVDNSPGYKNLGMMSSMRIKESLPKSPVNTMAGWKSSFIEAPVEAT